MARITIDVAEPRSWGLPIIREVDADPEDAKRSHLAQLDWDYPGFASTFGWSPCDCGATDGTIDCDHRTASEMIAEAHQYLLDHEGDEVDDPGYFVD